MRPASSSAAGPSWALGSILWELDMDYTVVVPAYNEEQFLPRTLAALKTAMAGVRDLDGEIVVVDNNCTDRSAEIAEALGARVVHEPVNQISRARNRGASSAEGRYLVFIDADTVVTCELVSAALDALAGGEVCGGGATIASSDAMPRGARASLHVWNWLSRRLGLAAGCFVFCPRDAWRDVGGFSQNVYAGEEIFFSRALRRWGRTRGLRFVVLSQEVDTSMRKVEWYSAPQLAWRFLGTVVFPWRIRSREACALWYERPGAPTEREGAGDSGAARAESHTAGLPDPPSPSGPATRPGSTEGS